MQNLKEEFKEYSDILDTDFSDWDDDFFSENTRFSDVENKLQSKHLIKNLQSSSNKIDIQSGISPICREVSCNKNIASSKWKEIRLSKLCTVSSRDHTFQKEQKLAGNFCQNKTSCIRKHPDEHSDLEDFCAPIKKRKKIEIQSVHIFVKPDEALTQIDVPINLVNNQTDSISVVEVPVEEMSKSQSDMTISMSSQGSKMSVSQELDSQKEVKISHSQTMTDYSQEISETTKSCSQTSLSPKIIRSSQESLGNEILNIKLDENILNATSQCETRIVTTPNIKSSNKNSFSGKKMKAGFPEKNRFIENLASSVSDTSCIKSDRRYNKEQKKVIWNIRKRELEVTKRENAVEIREKLLDAREANIQKREEMIKARERKYLNRKAKIKNKLQKRGIKAKILKKRIGVLEDDTNSFNTRKDQRVQLSPYQVIT